MKVLRAILQPPPPRAVKLDFNMARASEQTKLRHDNLDPEPSRPNPEQSKQQPGREQELRGQASLSGPRHRSGRLRLSAAFGAAIRLGAAQVVAAGLASAGGVRARCPYAPDAKQDQSCGRKPDWALIWH